MHAFAIEAEQVILKLKDMRTRWQESLPFHEAKDVHFSETRDQLRGWSAKLDEEPGIKQTVSELTDELDALEEFFCSDLKDEQFKELASRLVQQNCQTAIKQAHDLVHREHNSWPKRYEKERAGKMKEFVKKELVSVVRDDDLKYYIDLDYPELLEDACFGQYLFKARHELSMEQVQQMVKLCTVIQDLNGYIDPNLEIRKRRDAAVGGQPECRREEHCHDPAPAGRQGQVERRSHGRQHKSRHQPHALRRVQTGGRTAADERRPVEDAQDPPQLRC